MVLKPVISRNLPTTEQLNNQTKFATPTPLVEEEVIMEVVVKQTISLIFVAYLIMVEICV